MKALEVRRRLQESDEMALGYFRTMASDFVFDVVVEVAKFESIYAWSPHGGVRKDKPAELVNRLAVRENDWGYPETSL